MGSRTPWLSIPHISIPIANPDLVFPHLSGFAFGMVHRKALR